MKLSQTTKDAFNFTEHPNFGASLKSWWKSLAAVNFNITPIYWPKTIFITGNILLNTPIQWWEKLRYQKKINATKVKAPVFILGHPRSGTTLLHYLLSKDPSFNYCTTSQALIPNVYFTIGNLLSDLLQKALPSTRPMDNLKMGAELPKEEEFAIGNMTSTSMVQGYVFPKKIKSLFDENVLFTKQGNKENWQKHFQYLCQKLSLNRESQQLLLKSPNNTARVKAILECYPDAKFIHIYRNPYKVYLSNERLYEKILPMTALQKVNALEIEEFIFYSYKSIMQQYFIDKKHIPEGQLIEIAYEDFVKNPFPNIENIYSQFFPQRLPEVKPLIEKEWENYSNYQTNIFEIDNNLKNKINREWDFAFQALGYEKD